jgi:hypothetical protein
MEVNLCITVDLEPCTRLSALTVDRNAKFRSSLQRGGLSIAVIAIRSTARQDATDIDRTGF